MAFAQGVLIEHKKNIGNAQEQRTGCYDEKDESGKHLRAMDATVGILVWVHDQTCRPFPQGVGNWKPHSDHLGIQLTGRNQARAPRVGVFTFQLEIRGNDDTVLLKHRLDYVRDYCFPPIFAPETVGPCTGHPNTPFPICPKSFPCNNSNPRPVCPRKRHLHC